MNAVDLFLWVVVPYVALTVFLVGHIWRYRTDQFGWTSRSSQLQERKLLKFGGPLFHYGAFAAIAGHVIGILLPETWTREVGISERVYHDFSAWAGTAAIVLLGAGLLILLYRRFTNRRIRAVTTPVDVAVYVLLVVIIGLGAMETVGFNLIGSGYNYRETVALWFRGIFTAHPDVTLMTTAPFIYQIHVLLAWLLLMLWPFSRLVHAWSYPIWYLWRPYVLYRRRFPARATRQASRRPARV